jgi:hypothetical protein
MHRIVRHPDNRADARSRPVAQRVVITRFVVENAAQFVPQLTAVTARETDSVSRIARKPFTRSLPGCFCKLFTSTG